MDVSPDLETPDDPAPRRFRYVTRKGWRAARPRRMLRIAHPVNRVVIHFRWGDTRCLDQTECREYLQYEQRRLIREMGEDDIPFHFLIGGDGSVYEGRGWHFVCSRTLIDPDEDDGYSRFDVAYIGDYTEEDRVELSTPVLELMAHGVVLGYVADDWSLEEEPLAKEDRYRWPPKSTEPRPPRLWW